MKKIIAFSLVMIFYCSNAFSQINLNRIRDRVADKVEQKIGDKIADKVEDKIDERFDNQDTATKKKKRAWLKIPSFEPGCDVEDKYSFQYEFVMDMYSVNPKEKGKDSFSMNMSICFENKGNNIAMVINNSSVQNASANGMKLITNLKDSCFVTLMNSDGNKIGMSMSLNGITNTQNEIDQIELKKTNKTKTILGQTCYEYIGENKSIKQTAWISKEGSDIWEKYIENGHNSMSNPQFQGANISKLGFPLESKIENLKDKTITYTFVREINKNKKIDISTDGYSFMN